MSSSAPLPPRLGRASRSRLRWTALFILILLAGLIGRLFYLQVLDPNQNAAKLNKQQLLSQVIPAKRGQILDANGKVLAQSVVRYDIVLDQTVMAGRTTFKRSITAKDGSAGTETVSVEQASKEIAQVLGLQTQQVLKAVTGTKSFAYVFQGATEEQKAKVFDVGFPGLYADQRDVRQYPMGQVGGSIVGYTNSEKPLAGVELMEQSLLQGTNGSRVFQIGRDGIRNPYGTSTTTPAKDGSSVKLTIDSDLQWYAQQEIASATARLNGDWGNVIVMDVKTGKILAMADSTTVDPNDISKNKGTAGLQPIGIVDGFEPGSTAKVITFAAALEKGLIEPETKITAPNRYTVDGETFKDYTDHPTWYMTAAGVLAHSLNTGTVQIAQKLTPQERYDWLKKFGVGTPVGLGFPGEQAGLLKTPDKWDARSAYTLAFGQGFTQTALHTAQIYQTIANGGVKVKPSLIESTIAADGTETKTDTPSGERIISEKTALELNHMMENVTVNGSGITGQLKNYRVATKTGTAQSIGPSGIYDAYTISFAGFAPAENPRFVVVTTISRTMDDTSARTGPVFADIMERVLTMNHVPPSTTKPVLYKTRTDGLPD
jgi:cell division protein FtsI (penicillin-binding protein 3)